MRYGSVCSGIEAATVAWHPLGWEPAFFSEIEKFPSAVLAHHYPHVPNHGDMTRFSEWPDAALDVLVGGTPCQSFSVAGLRKGLADPRGNLMLTYLAIAERYRPRWLVWENVPGVLSSNGGKDFGALLGGLGELGYGWAYRVLDAQYFGVAQRRRRVFVVGHLGDWRPAAAVLFERASLQGHPAPRRQARKGTAADVAGSLTASGRGVERPGDTRGQDPVVAVYGGNRTSGELEVSPGLNAKGGSGRMDFESEALVAHTLRANHDASEDGTGRGTPLVPVSFEPGVMSREGGHVYEDISGTLRKEPGDNQMSVLAPQPIAIHPRSVGREDAGPEGKDWRGDGVSFTMDTSGAGSVLAPQPIPINTMAALRPQGSDENRQTFGIGEPGDPMPTLSKAHSHAVAQPLAFKIRQGCEGGGKGYLGAEDQAFTLATHQDQHLYTGMAVRRLTPRECERLQGFPDDYTLIPHRGKPAADGPRYKALGNSMAVPVMAWIGLRIQQVEDILGGEA